MGVARRKARGARAVNIEDGARHRFSFQRPSKAAAVRTDDAQWHRRQITLLRARAAVAAPPPIQLRL